VRAVLRRELSAYFHSPIGYVFLAVFYFFSGYFFTLTCLRSMNASLSGVFAGLFSILLFLVPILTMRLMSEELRGKTDQLLLTAPISLTGMVLGKYLAALLVYLLGISITLVYALVISTLTSPHWPMVLGSFLGALLLGMAMIAIGMFISSLTQNQVIAAVGGFGAALFLILVDGLGSYLTNETLVGLVMALSFYQRFQSFALGILSLSGVGFFLGVAAIFLFLTIRVFEKRRWS
jgi:ABC-2 type transport system permease protein